MRLLRTIGQLGTKKFSRSPEAQAAGLLSAST